MRNARDWIAVAIVALSGFAPAVHATTESQARQYVFTAFLTHAVHSIIHEQVALGPELRPRLALPPGTSSAKIYEALVALTDGKDIRVRKATDAELSGYGQRAGFDAAAHPVFTVEAGDLRLLVQYDLDADKIPYVGQLGLPDPTPRPVVAKAEPALKVSQPVAKTASVNLVWTSLFAYDSATLSADARAALDANIVGRLKEMGMVGTITINGYADQLGPADYNQRLSEKRAEQVRTYLISRGVAPEKTHIEAHGPSAPVTRCDQLKTHKERVDCLAPNRRVVVEVRGR